MGNRSIALLTLGHSMPGYRTVVVHRQPAIKRIREIDNDYLEVVLYLANLGIIRSGGTSEIFVNPSVELSRWKYHILHC